MTEQHDPAGAIPPGYHPSWWSDGAATARARTMCYWRYCRPGDLVFDIGANIGDITRVFLEMGCRVVAVEPQAEIAEHIPAEAEIVVAAVGATAGMGTLHAVAANPALSSMRHDIAETALTFNGSWTSVERGVEVVTMDQLIEEYGVPVFAKIDVEGFELEVLNGLSRPLQALSFEAHNFDTGKVGGCIARLDELSGGRYGYLYSRGDSYQLEPFPPTSYGWYGDVYASLRP